MGTSTLAQINLLLDLLLDESSAGSLAEANARLEKILDPGPGFPLDPQHGLLRLTSALLARLLRDRDYEAWSAEDCDDTDGLLRELIHQAQALRPRMVAGIPDPPARAEIWARAMELTDGPGDYDDRPARLLAATVEAFTDAGLRDGQHFVNMAAHVWGMPKHL
jgi:hypothetical protein